MSSCFYAKMQSTLPCLCNRWLSEPTGFGRMSDVKRTMHSKDAYVQNH
jgi:hypothetical protein